MKKKILDVIAGILIMGSMLYIYGVAGSLELAVITVGQALFRCIIGFVIMITGAVLSRWEGRDTD